MDERPDTLRLALFDRFVGPTTSAGEGMVQVAVRNVTQPGGIGDTTRAVVVQVDTFPAGIPVPADAFAVAATEMRAPPLVKGSR